MRHYNIPVFIPELACPHRCIFCNQNRISGIEDIPDPVETAQIIRKHLQTIPQENSQIQVAFFGGSFTAVPVELQESYLKAVQPFIRAEKVKSIRISTRPDYIKPSILHMLKSYGVTHIELGAQSLSDKVLKLSARGHNADEIRKAAKLILEYDITLGLQMMIGLPGDSEELAMETARQIVDLGALETRIYPTLVIKNTPLAKLWQNSGYTAFTLENAVEISAKLYEYFTLNSVKILRVGLYPSSDFTEGDGLLDGPFHPNFKELVLSQIWKNHLTEYNLNSNENYQIYIPQNALNHAVGYKKSNVLFFNKSKININFSLDKTLKNFESYVHIR